MIKEIKKELIKQDLDLREKLLENGAVISTQAGFNIVYFASIDSDYLEEELKRYYLIQSKLYLLNNSNEIVLGLCLA
jgi:hypothetical protein